VSRYGISKLVIAQLAAPGAAHMRAGDDLAKHLPGLRAGIAEVVEAGESQVKVKAKKDVAPEVAAALLTQLKVLDIEIEAEDVGTVIEAMIRKDPS
jgi:hypothetical protein